MSLKSIRDIDQTELRNRRFHPSPVAWEDQVFYFLLLDRFSDGKEKGYRANNGKPVAKGTTPQFTLADAGNAVQTPADAQAWRDAGGKWNGGSLKGLTSKMGYLARLGITAVWVSPIFKQVSFQETYHGYGIQNFLEVDSNFGNGEELRKMVATAHHHGIHVILDIILNHSGNVFSYQPDRYWTQNQETKQWYLDPRWDGNLYQVAGFNDATGNPVLPFAPQPAQPASAWPDGAVWPSEFQDPACYSQKGRISNWDNFPEYLEGDFCDLKNINLGWGDIVDYHPSAAFATLCEAYKYWLAYADIDGYRIDTVKHMDPGATRIFASVIHEFAQSIGKENFYLIGEITGGRERAFDTLEATGLDAALGIDDIPDKLEYLVKGYRNPSDYFDLFRNSLQVQKDSHVWFRNKVITLYDDHDQVRKGESKARFCADGVGQQQALAVLAMNATTLGIPCIYYGSEQCFDGQGGNDRYIREAMFGGSFGAFRSHNRHFFNEDHPVYQELAKILAIRASRIPLRRGRQFLRQISGDGLNFGLPRMIGGEIRSVVPWSRIFDQQELLLAINTDSTVPHTVWTTIDSGLHSAGNKMKCIYSTDKTQIGRELTVEPRNGMAVQLTLPAAGFVIYE